MKTKQESSSQINVEFGLFLSFFLSQKSLQPHSQVHAEA